MPYNAFCYFYAHTYGAPAFALQKLFSVYYQSTTYPIEDLKLESLQSYGGPCDGSLFDEYALTSMSTDTLSFYSVDYDKMRVEKEEALGDFPAAQKFLTPCGRVAVGVHVEGRNCSHCKKCDQTMAGLYAAGKLDNFSQVFDVQDFKSHLARRLGWWFGVDSACFTREFKVYAKKHGVKIPFGARLLEWFIARPYMFVKHMLRNFVWARKIYYGLKLDYKLNGYRNEAQYNKYKKMM